ncbi:MAG: GspH/FimT family pseudopilin [Candidatus Omnitrophota bacterium]
MNYRLRTHRGFSLIELILAFVIMGILAAIVIPRVTKADLYNKFLIYTTAHQVAGDLRLARRLAVTNGDDYKLGFTADTYAIFKDNSGAWDQIGEEKTIGGDITRTGTTSITFSPSGAASGNGNFKFEAGTTRYKADVTRSTGSVVLGTY